MAPNRNNGLISGRSRLLILLAVLFVLALPPAAAHASGTHTIGDEAVQQGGQWYIVKSGDTLYSIANRYGTTVSNIMRANGLTSATIYVGQRLWIPTGGGVPPQQGGVWYIVKPGDTLYSIAKTHGTTVTAIMRANNIKTPNKIYVGQRLWIPGAPPPPVVCNQWYTVQPGDTLYSIAKRYNTTVEALMLMNHLRSTYIYVGQLLCVPGSGPIATTTPGTPASTATPGPTPTPTPQGSWTGQYFNNRDMAPPVVFSQKSTSLDFDWGDGSPNPAVNIDNFSAKYEGAFHFNAGLYRFLLLVDDGGRVFLDDKLILDGWREQSKTGYFVDVSVTSGNHNLRVEYFEATARASISLSWRIVAEPK
ncbi:MAG: LysM peptidoglycan-binding domain-containing protein [Caldilineales bacterium]|nr:LysM peptidoglycan-binding domain-containing protein [Caldilineales bacterium]